ncbi:hypothetical protein [Scytonema sp. PRP1]|uniref:hypothetical protein n=1 Tax=Scytonema sp. PRP1 TaxID=3120513 RepID=UPI00300DB636
MAESRGHAERKAHAPRTRTPLPRIAIAYRTAQGAIASGTALSCIALSYHVRLISYDSHVNCTPHASRLLWGKPSFALAPLYPLPLRVCLRHATRTPVAYGGKPACSAGLTACGEGT